MDRKGKGRLSKVDFTILLFLMHRVLGDVELPEVLPPSLRESVVIMPGIFFVYLIQSIANTFLRISTRHGTDAHGL